MTTRTKILCTLAGAITAIPILALIEQIIWANLNDRALNHIERNTP
jgi:hypothetical protein